MSKPLIFISHISEESDIAKMLKEFIMTHFRNGVDIFVSSDGRSISGGREWFEQIDYCGTIAPSGRILAPLKAEKKPVSVEVAPLIFIKGNRKNQRKYGFKP